MQNYILLTDATADLTQALVDQHQIEQIPMEVWIDETLYHIYPDEREITIHKFYQELRVGKRGKTSLINAAGFIAAFKPYLDAGQDILYVGVSKTLSGTVGQAHTAAEILQSDYPDRKIIVVNSFSASLGLGLLAIRASINRAAGMSIQANADDIRAIRGKVNAIFTVPTLDSLRKGGRVRGATALIANLLNIKPVLFMNDEGDLVSLKKVRTWPHALRELAVQTAERVTPEMAKEQVLYIGHSDDLESAHKVGDFIAERLTFKEIVYTYLGPVIGAHGGPGTICLFFIGTHR